MNNLEHFLNQLDLLIGLIDVSDKEVYEQVKTHKHLHLKIPLEELFNHDYYNYSKLITTSTLILGLSYFEDFLGKCIAEILIKHPDRNDLRVTLKIIHEKGDSLITYLAEDQGKRMPFSEKIIFIEKNIPGVNGKLLSELKFVYNIRNCIMHNNGKADVSLISKYSAGQQIALSPDDINKYGLLVRQSAKDIWDKFAAQYVTLI